MNPPGWSMRACRAVSAEAKAPSIWSTDLVGSGLWSGSTPCASAGRRARRAGAQTRAVPVRRAGRKRLTRLGLARQGGAPEFLLGVDGGVTLLAP